MRFSGDSGQSGTNPGIGSKIILVLRGTDTIPNRHIRGITMEREDLKKTVIVGVVVVVCILVFIFFFPHQRAGTGTGYLQGTVTIGPLCPVEPCHISEEQRAAAYAARHLVVSGPGYSGIVPEAGFPPDGNYRIALPTGTYDVSLPPGGIGGSPDLPRHIVVRSGQATFLNISIDTGIR